MNSRMFRKTLVAVGAVCAVAVASLSVTGVPVPAERNAAAATRLESQLPPPHFAGLPAAGTKASTPLIGRMLIDLRPTQTTIWTVYADGRVIWQKWAPSGDATVVPAGASRLDTAYIQQRLTLRGVLLLRSKLLATGLFENNLNLRTRNAWIFDRIRTGDRIVTVSGSPYPGPTATKPTLAQTRALAWIAKLVADPARWLPPSEWANRHVQPFVPARYHAEFDRSSPDLSKLPPPARQALSHYVLGHGCLLTTAHTRELLRAFAEAGIAPSENRADMIAFSLAGTAKTPTGKPIPSDFHLSPALPDERC